MALINCPECAQQVSDLAAACPDCGYPLNSNHGRSVDAPVHRKARPAARRPVPVVSSPTPPASPAALPTLTGAPRPAWRRVPGFRTGVWWHMLLAGWVYSQILLVVVAAIASNGPAFALVIGAGLAGIVFLYARRRSIPALSSPNPWVSGGAWLAAVTVWLAMAVAVLPERDGLAAGPEPGTPRATSTPRPTSTLRPTQTPRTSPTARATTVPPPG